LLFELADVQSRTSSSVLEIFNHDHDAADRGLPNIKAAGIAPADTHADMECSVPPDLDLNQKNKGVFAAKILAVSMA
jgi:hypothetical protein